MLSPKKFWKMNLNPWKFFKEYEPEKATQGPFPSSPFLMSHWHIFLESPGKLGSEENSLKIIIKSPRVLQKKSYATY